MTAASSLTTQGVAALAARGVTVRLGPATIVADVDLDVHRGEVVALVGPNGAGKSTLLAALAGDLEVVTGTVEVGGRPLARWRIGDLARERAVLTQEQRIAFPFAVEDVVRMGRTPWRRHPAEDRDDEVVAQAMALTEVTHLAARAFGLLSGGEKARTAFARALAQETGVLLLDEPTAALDLGHQEAVLAIARAAADDGAAVVVVLHDLSLAAAWSDRIVLLEAGRVAASGTPAEVLRPELLSAVYQHPIEVLTHPRTGALLVLADRQPARQPARQPSRQPSRQELT